MTSTKAKALLNLGNRKLGGTVHTFSLPAIDTCPGRSGLCEAACYATKGMMRFTQKTYVRAWKESKKRDFVRRMVGEIRDRGVTLLRIHVSGDFYSAAYIRKWRRIVEASPQCRFYVYTRSWRKPELRAELAPLAKLRNIRVHYSCDRETGFPGKIGKRVRVVYMATEDEDVPKGRVDLMFRVKRTTVQKFAAGKIVCPAENGVTKTTCQSCGLCWDRLEVKDPRRFALPLA